MKLNILLVTALLAGCSPAGWMLQPGLPGELARNDQGTITGTWREIRRDGRSVSSGYAPTIGSPSPYTFAAQKECTTAGGVLVQLAADEFRIERYEDGLETAGCGPWRAGPEIAPFNGSAVTLQRRGVHLVATGSGHSVELVRLAVR
jgi:hypothetical protein